MSAAALLERCRAAGVSLVADGDVLRVKAGLAPPADLLAELKAHKAEVLAALSAEVAPPRDLSLDELATWLRTEGVCLVQRDGRLIFTGPDGRGASYPAAALQAFVDSHHDELLARLTVADPADRRLH